MFLESPVWHVPFSPRKDRFRNSAGAFSDVKRLRFLMRLPDITPDHRGNVLFSGESGLVKRTRYETPDALFPLSDSFSDPPLRAPFASCDGAILPRKAQTGQRPYTST